MLNIRTATEADVARITEIYRDAVVHGAATYELEPPTQDEMLARFRNLMEQRYPYIVGESEGVVVGYAYAGPFRARPAYRFMVEDSIYIAPEAKGRGVGKSLLNALIERCRADGYRQFVAVIGDGGPQSPSVRLHEAVGMTHCGVLTGSGYKHERWLDTTFMQLALNGGNELPPDPDSVPETVFNASR